MDLGISQIFSSFSLQKITPLNFLQNPIFLKEISVFLHFLLFSGLIITWVYTIFAKNDKNQTKKPTFLYHKLLILTCLFLLLYNSLFFCLNYFYFYANVWSFDKLITLLDLALRTLTWFLFSIYLYTKFHPLNDLKPPFLLRIWWVFYLLISSYCLVVIDIIQCRENKFLIQNLVSDVVYVISGILFCIVGIFMKITNSEESNLQEPFLNCNNNNNINSCNIDNIPYIKAGFLSKLTCTWMGPLISKGYRKTLDLDDIPGLSGMDDASESYRVFRNCLDSCKVSNDKKVTSFQLMKSLIFTVWLDIFLTGILCLIYSLASFVGPYLIDDFVQYLNGKREFKYEGVFLVLGFFIAKIVECFSQRHWFFRLQVSGVRVKAALIEIIYNKSLTLSSVSKEGQSSGEMINIMSVDVERIGMFGWYMHDPWLLIVQITLGMIILYRSLGLASIATFVSMIGIMLANYPLSNVLEKYQGNLMESKDKRMKATSEILRNMRILKLQAWEMKFLSKIIELRNNENKWLKKFLYTTAMLTFLFWSAPIFVAVITFGACIIMGIPLESGKVLSALATFRILQDPIYYLPDTISMIIQTKVSIDRIASFLSLDDIEHDNVVRLSRDTSKVAIEINEGNFSWDLTSPTPILKDINLRVYQGKRVAICGSVGSGKSTLLSCILGEVPKISGVVRVCVTKAYVAQSPWIQSGKIVDNILFGKEMDRQKYDRVLEACSLKQDLEVFSFGDQTIIGERGINLSGGQKQRIQIARALYQDADIYLFDDPFSAVDAHTSSHLFKECLLGLLNSKTVIYVTHQVEFLPSADLILVMKNGRILQAGKYDEILQSGTDFIELVGAHEQALSALNPIENKGVNPIIGEEYNDKRDSEEEVNDDQVGITDENTIPQGQLVQEEEREKGSVGFPVYWKFITIAYSGALVPFILLAQILFQTLQILSNYWIAWATPSSGSARNIVDGRTLILVYSGLALGSSFCVLARTTLLVTATYETATLLFSKMHLCIFRASMSFFDSTPSGRILNRASTDQSAVDMTIAGQVGAVAFLLIQVIGTILVMSQITWQVFVAFIPVIAVAFWCQRYYLPSARELSRLIGVTKAPVIQFFSETISGAITIRSFDQESRFCETSLELVNEYSRPNFYNAAAMQWLSIRLDLLCSITFVTSLIFLISVPVGLIDPGIAGLSVTYGLTLNKLQGFLVRNLCNVEQKIISVERILQYTVIPSEPPLIVETNRPNSSWPSHGEVEIQNLQVRYAPHLPLVLRGITCTFQGGKKTGIVGRTGSGKSTLIQTLFRIVEPTMGRIMLDNIDICSIGLHDLRSRLSIIPQDPTMFEGTIRSNLDPLEEYSDEQIWEALDKCQLGDEVRKKEGKLDSVVVENGENWSMGQRQLVCLGRVLLKRSKVLILDEATASVDTTTDNLIQKTLREHFSDSTVIIIAHRITSVIDSDMVVLLSQGLVKECDSPMRLLENKSSLFAKLVAEYTTRSSSSVEKPS